MKLARRLSSISASPTITVMQEAQRLKKQGIDIIDFGPGEPDFPTPGPVKQAGVDSINADFTRYTASSGILELRQAVADKYNREWGTDFGSSNVIITAGAKQAIYHACMALFEEGDEVLNPAPYWVTFPEVIKLTGATPVDLHTRDADGFVLDPDDVAAALGTKTRGLIVTTPNNPTGAVIPREKVGQIAELGRKRGIFLLFDETYEYFTYGIHKHASLASFVKASDDFFAVVGSMSKTYSMTGWRVGYVVANKLLIEKIGEFQSHASGNVTSISQKAALAALTVDTKVVKVRQEEYCCRRELVLQALEGIPGFRCNRPDGAFYVFPNVSECLRRLSIANSAEFSRFLLREARVATVPGSAFGLEGYIRISYATSRENLKEGLSRIKQAVSSLPGR
jgi:aspartate aminotransferase